MRTQTQQEVPEIFTDLHGNKMILPEGEFVTLRRSVYALIVSSDNRVLLLEPTYAAGIMVLPGGEADDHESLWTAVVRETEEEINFDISTYTGYIIAKKQSNFFDNINQKYRDGRITIFLVCVPSQLANAPIHIPIESQHEITKAYWIPIDDIPLEKAQHIFKEIFEKIQKQQRDEKCCGVTATDPDNRALLPSFSHQNRP